MVETEHYTLKETPDDPFSEFWLENQDGEGMSIGVVELDKLLDQYFKENF